MTTHGLRSSLWFIFDGSHLMLRSHEDGLHIPSERVFQELDIEIEVSHEVGEIDGVRCNVALISSRSALSSQHQFYGLRETIGLVEDSHFGMAGRAFQILEWERNHQYCGQCGAATEQTAGEWAKSCIQCGLMNYPRLSPAVIMRIPHGDRLLLTHSPHHPEGFYTVPAGFVEPGETLEEAVVREIREEVGLAVKNIQYFGSQPWPFPHQLMIAFTAEYASGEVVVDNEEIVEAIWCSADEIPRIPEKISISRALIDSFVRAQSS
mgnify:CR=1 FL=1